MAPPDAEALLFDLFPTVAGAGLEGAGVGLEGAALAGAALAGAEAYAYRLGAQQSSEPEVSSDLTLKVLAPCLSKT